MSTLAKTAGKWLLAALGLVALSLAAALLLRAELVERAVIWALESSGVRAALDVTRVGPNEMFVEGLRLGDGGEIQIDRIELRFALAELWRGELTSVAVTGVEARIQIDESGWSLGSLDAVLQGPSGRSPPSFLLRSIQISDATLLFGLGMHIIPLKIDGVIEGVAPGENMLRDARAEGRLDLSVKGLSSPDLAQDLDVELHAELEKLEDAVVLQVQRPFTLRAKQIGEGVLPVALSEVALNPAEPDSLPMITLSGTGQITTQGSLHLEAAELQPMDLTWRATSLERQGRRLLQIERASARAESLQRAGIELRPFEISVSNWSQGQRILVELERSHATIGDETPILKANNLKGTVLLPAAGGVESQFALEADKLHYGGQALYSNPLSFQGTAQVTASTVSIEGTAVDSREAIEANVQIDYDRARSTTQLSVETSAKQFSAGLQPAQLMPLLEGSLPTIEGSLSARFSADLSPAGKTDLYVSLVDVVVDTDESSVENLTGVIHIDSFNPIQLPSWQVLHFDGLTDGELEVGRGLAAFSLDAARKLTVLHVDSEMIGGTIRADGEADLVSGNQHIELGLKSLDLAKLVASLGIDGLSATGAIGGTLPLVGVGDDLIVQSGQLAAEGVGSLRYLPPGGFQLPGLSAEQLTLISSLLSDFHYESLRLFVNGDPLGDLEVRAELRGRNPKVQDGRPVEFNLNITGPAGQLIRGPLAMFRMPKKLTDRMVKQIHSQSRK